TLSCRAEIAIHYLGLCLQLFGSSPENNMAGVEHIATASHGKRCLDVLLDDHNSAALGGQILAHIHDIPNNQGRKPFEGFVQENKGRITYHGASNGHHLLLAPGQRTPLVVATLV